MTKDRTNGRRGRATQALRIAGSCVARLLLAVGMAFAFACVLAPEKAYADAYRYDVTGGYGAIVGPHPWTQDGRRAALAEFMGYGWDTFTDEQKAKLFSEGPNFNSGLQNVKNWLYEYNQEFTQDGGAGEFAANIGSLFGGNQIWVVSMSQSEYQQLQMYMIRVLSNGMQGDDETGSGDEPLEAAPDYIDLGTGTGKAYLQSNVLYGDASSINVRLIISSDVKTQWNSLIAEGYKYYCGVAACNKYATWNCNLYISKNPITYEIQDHETEGAGIAQDMYYVYVNVPDDTKYMSKSAGPTVNNGNLEITLNSRLYNGTSGKNPFMYCYGYWLGTNGQVSTPDPEPTPPPYDEPTPQPTPPSAGPLVINDDTPPADNTYNYNVPDNGDILQDIYEYLQEFCIAMQTDHNDIRNLLVWIHDDMVSSIEQAGNYVVDGINAYLDYLHKCLERYLKMFEDAIIEQLKLIRAKLTGNQTAKPDASTDSGGFFAWLLRMFGEFFAGLVGTIATLATQLDPLKSKFPFSLPWDFATILGLLVASPVTPVFQLPQPVPTLVSGTNQVTNTVNLSSWNGVAETIRHIEFLLYAVVLIMHVPKWIEQLKIGGE